MAPAQETGLDVDLRRHVAHHLIDRRDVIVADAVATFPLMSGSRRLDANYCMRLGTLVTQLLSDAILEGCLDSRGPKISELAADLTHLARRPRGLSDVRNRRPGTMAAYDP